MTGTEVVFSELEFWAKRAVEMGNKEMLHEWLRLMLIGAK
jgi:hypothetical protein